LKTEGEIDISNAPERTSFGLESKEAGGLKVLKKKFKIDGLNLTDIIKSNHSMECGAPAANPMIFDKPTPL
jgi:hypothetical protein